MVVQGQLASHLFEGEDLSKGLSPFTCGFQVGERDTAISSRALCFHQMQLGHTAPTLTEQDTLRTKEAPVTQSIYELGTQVACTSVVLDVVLGDDSPLATTIRNFCIAEWPLMEASLHAMGWTLRLSSPPCYDGCSCRWLPTSEALALVAICRCPASSTSMMWCSSAPSTCCPHPFPLRHDHHTSCCTYLKDSNLCGAPNPQEHPPKPPYSPLHL